MGDDTSGGMHYAHRMSDADALMWSIEKDPMLRSTVTTVVVLDGRPDPSDLRRALERLSRVVPRLRQRVRSNPLSLAPPRWEVDPNFDLRYHFRSVNAPGKGGLADVLALAEPIAMQGFDRARPLWEATYVCDGADGSALVLKFHHSITDGVGGVRLMLELFDLEADAPRRPMVDAPPVHVMNQAERFADAVRHQTRLQAGVLRRLGSGAAATAGGFATDPVGSVEATRDLAESVSRLLAPATQPLSPLMTGRSLSAHFDVVELPMGPMKAAGHVGGGKLNDAFVAGILLGIRRYHDRRGATLDALRMGMPINLRTPALEEVAGNAFVPARFRVPVDTDDAAELLRRTHDCLDRVVHEPANALVEPLSNFINRLPTTVTTGLFGSMMRGLDFQASNVPGSPLPMYLLGVPVQMMVPFGPLAGAATNITLLSYCSTLHVGVNVDPAAVTHPGQFMECLREGWDEVMAVGGSPPAARVVGPGAERTGAENRSPARRGATGGPSRSGNRSSQGKGRARKTTAARKRRDAGTGTGSGAG